MAAGIGANCGLGHLALTHMLDSLNYLHEKSQQKLPRRPPPLCNLLVTFGDAVSAGCQQAAWSRLAAVRVNWRCQGISTSQSCLMKQTLRSRVTNVTVLASWNVTLYKCWRFLAMWNLLQIGLPWNSHIFDINVRWIKEGWIVERISSNPWRQTAPSLTWSRQLVQDESPLH